jgi:hypothetical protein
VRGVEPFIKMGADPYWIEKTRMASDAIVVSVSQQPRFARFFLCRSGGKRDARNSE